MKKGKGVFSRYAKQNLTQGVSQTEEEYAKVSNEWGQWKSCSVRIGWPKGTGKSARDDHDAG